MRDRKNDQHRRTATRAAGRPLDPNEIVHHKDEDKANNDPSNLTVEDRAAHTARHNKARGLSRLRKSLRLTQGKGEKLY